MSHIITVTGLGAWLGVLKNRLVNQAEAKFNASLSFSEYLKGNISVAIFFIKYVEETRKEKCIKHREEEDGDGSLDQLSFVWDQFSHRYSSLQVYTSMVNSPYEISWGIGAIFWFYIYLKFTRIS
jgi:hypothetical protein